jgi:Tol biopolymer transport system component
MKAATQLRNAILPAALLLSLPSLALAERGFQASDMVSMDRFSSPVLSPDGRKLVFAKRTVDMASGKATTSLWIEDLFARDSAPPARLTHEGWNVNSPAISKDGKTV